MFLSSNNPFNNNPKLVIFDLCGTLLNSKDLDHRAIDYTLKCFCYEKFHFSTCANN